ncbi:DNA mismatch repair endonuclease MutL [Peptoniphilus equinus]|uniref:DNA mismatch repair protein MutL n=1 Tax=Peptoniphilus equinus TaxID=3016343 RepID=A0ABY7QWP9_9FIRM|nr:DNA mismatch repair endonuclease MutL [Peptoniphilus equinus]WBW50700.1 DNA mismatch repair endonuclease MutL [Peptoniphilus equinus]
MINILDEKTISKIAAGEIIENPAAIVKELIENSIDAQATSITVEIKGTATEGISVRDNGTGIESEDIDKAFLRHATSKMAQFDDLNYLKSLGFRGEALASIASIATVELLTKTKDSVTGSRTLVQHGDIVAQNKIGVPVGTTFYITDIFEHTPVRKKFLKAESVELHRIVDMVKKIALGTPHCAFKLIKNSRILFQSSTSTSLKDHVYSILGNMVAQMNYIEKDFDHYSVKAFFSDNTLYRSQRTEQYLFINGRYIWNVELARLIEKAYRSSIPLDRYPCFVIYLTIDPKLIDINIHPQKNEVKFSNGPMLMQSIRDLAEVSLATTKTFISSHIPSQTASEPLVTIFDLYRDDPEGETTSQIQSEVHDTITPYSDRDDLLDSHDKLRSVPTAQSLKEDTTSMQTARTDLKRIDTDRSDMSKIPDLRKKPLQDARIVGALFGTYIIFEARDGVFFLMDQHAAHERVHYEKFLKQYNDCQVDSQLLLKPEIIGLSAEEMVAFDKLSATLNTVGFDVEVFSADSIIVRAVPLIAPVNFEDFLRHSLLTLTEASTSAYEISPYTIMKKACKAAIKANTTLSFAAIQGLKTSLLACEDPYTCPHGRPTVVRLDQRDLEKLFLRG